MHKEYTALMSAVLDHEATTEDAVRLHEHLDACPACTVIWGQWRALDTYLWAAPLLAAPTGLMSGVMQKLQAEQQRKRRQWLGSGLLLAWGSVITVLWLVALVAVWWCFSHPLELGELLASGAHTLSGLAWLLRTVQSYAAGMGGVRLSLGVGFYLGMTGLLMFAWIWMVLRKSAWARSWSPAGKS